MGIDPRLLEILRCPVTGEPLGPRDGGLSTGNGKFRFRVLDGIPCLMSPIAAPTHQGFTELEKLNEQAGEAPLTDELINDFMDRFASATCGNLFDGVKFRGRYPIPDFPDLRPGLTLDIGSNWGRWSIAGALAGHAMVGMDINLSSLRVAQRLVERLTPVNPPMFVLGDARTLPFADNAFDNVFSYSVIQHFSRENAAAILRECGRVLKPGGRAAIQMPNRNGLKALLTMPRRRFSAGQQFDVRYYSIEELTGMFEEAIGPARWSIDCFLGLNVHPKDRDLALPSRRWVIDAAETLRSAASILPPLARFSDSVWVIAEAR